MHWHDFTPKLVLEGAEKGARKSFASDTFLRTPRPWTFALKAGLLTCGSQHLFRPSRSFQPQWPKLERCSPLTVAGAVSALLRHDGVTHRIPVLAPNPCESKEPRTPHIVYEEIFSSINRHTKAPPCGSKRFNTWSTKA